MDDFKLVGTLDVTELVFLTFVLFFFGLIIYLRREDRREGYPLEDEVTGRLDTPGGVLIDGGPKSFLMPHGRGTVFTPTQGREPVDLPARRSFRSVGAPYVPTGNPLVDGMGPAAWANRADHPDLDAEGHNRIVPIGLTPHIVVNSRDPDPRGMRVIAADGVEVGTIGDIWVDRAEHVIRYLSIDTAAGTVLAPMGTAAVKGRARTVEIDAINAADFAAVPRTARPDAITFYEEERIMAYYGGGYLYANAARQEPLL